ncbi:MAG: heavy-metal-associated domain-containing protein [Pirellulales bacterium]|nr:heavy-metal-associated domain-containing protein [Pirellulales bacterium]
MKLKKLKTVVGIVVVAATVGCAEEATPEFNAAGLPTVEISVPGMMCEKSCVPTVRESLAGRPGVKEVRVDLATKTATVAIEAEQFDADAAVADLLDQGFEETKVADSAPKLAPPTN